MLLRVFIALIVAFGIWEPSFGAIIQGYTDNTNNRFANSSQFIVNPFNLSGVGQSNFNQWGTLISSNVIVAANHNAPSGSITFYPNNDPTSTPVVRQVSSNTQRIGGTDIWLAQLDNPVDTSIIVPFPVANEFITGPSNLSTPPGDPLLTAPAGSFQGTDAFLVGLLQVGGPATRNQAYGRNILAAFARDVVDPSTLLGVNDFLYFNVDNSHPYETTLQPGDSGAPVFAIVGSSLVLLGTNSAVSGTIANPTGSFAAYIGNYNSSVQAFIASAVPEPTSLASVCLVVLGLTFRRHRIVA